MLASTDSIILGRKEAEMKKHLITAIVVALVVVLIIPAGCAKPAEFEVTALDVSPAEVVSGDPADVTVEVENIGGSEGTYIATLELDGVKLETKEVTVPAGAKETVTWRITEGIGTHQVGVDGLSRSFKVLKPAEFEVVNLDIAPNRVKVGEQTTITVSIENVGEAEGTYSATLLVDGLVEQTTDVTLAGGATKPVSFVASKDTPGSYSIEIGGREAILTVIQPVRLETGTELVDELVGGMGKLKIENETEFDAVVVLCSPEEPKTPLLAVYVQSNDSYRAKGIEEGSYVSYVALGDGWDENSLKFLMNTTYYHDPREMEFKERRTERKREWTEWTVFLNLEYGTPGLPITEDEFPSLG